MGPSKSEESDDPRYRVSERLAELQPLSLRVPRESSLDWLVVRRPKNNSSCRTLATYAHLSSLRATQREDPHRRSVYSSIISPPSSGESSLSFGR